MICVFDAGNNNFEGNGNAVLTPTECKAKMVAGGNYDMTMVHPIDPDGKWTHLVPGAIVRIPVQEEEIENTWTGYEADVYKCTGAAKLRERAEGPTQINYPEWNPNGEYQVGSKVSVTGATHRNYKCTYFDMTSATTQVPPYNSSWWEPISDSTSGAPVLVSLNTGDQLYFVEDYNTGWYKMSTYYGVVGYIEKSKVTFWRHLTPSEQQPRFIKTQLMRIVGATADTKNHTVTVTAQHVSYDLNGVMVQDVRIRQASPALAIGRMIEGFMIDYPGTIANNLSAENNGTYSDDIKGKSGMYCLLDPDKGVVAKFDAALKRDNWDLFILQKTETDRGFRLKYRKNMLGVSWARKSDSLITRVVPTAKAEGGEDLYLPEKWIDSSRINDYPVIRMERLPVKGQVGKDKGQGDDSTWTEADLYTEMRTKARERFTVDKADRIVHEVSIDFEMLGDTEEYKELKGLEKVLLYDTVTAEDETIGLDMDLYVTEIEWDAIRRKILAAKLSNVQTRTGRTVTGYNVQTKSISPEKLTDDVAGDIVNQVVDILPEYADPDAKRPSSDAIPLTDKGAANGVATLDGSGKVPSGQLPSYVDDVIEFANRNAFPATGESGKIYVAIDTGKTYRWSGSAYVEISNPTVTDGNPTLAFGSQSTVGSVDGTNLHVTMPGAKASASTLLNAMDESTADLGDNDFVAKPGSTSYKVKLSKLWAYIKSKLGISSSGSTGKFLNEQGGWSTPAGTYSLPTASSSTKGGIKTGYTASGKNYPVQMSGENAYVNVPWTDTTYEGTVIDRRHQTDFSFTGTQPLSRFVTFDKSAPSGAPDNGWYNGFIASHNNYVASYIINKHRTGDWYVAWGEYLNGSAAAPTWYKLLHSGYLGFTQSGKNYPVVADSSGKLYVAVPWSDHYDWSDITNKPSTAIRWPAWNEVTGKPNRAGSATDGGDAYNSDKVDGYHASSFALADSYPNNTTDSKTKYRCCQSVNVGTTVKYYKIGQLQASSSNNKGHMIIRGRLGGWTSGNIGSIEAIITNRDAALISCILHTPYGTEATVYSYADIALYRETNGALTVYVKTYSYTAFDLDVEVHQGSITYDGTSVTAPTGTLQVLASTSGNRRAYIGGNKPTVAGNPVNTWRGYMLRNYTKSYNAAANAHVSFRGEDFDTPITTPEGYTPVAAADVKTGNEHVAIEEFIATATGVGRALRIRNTSSSAQPGTVQLKILYLQNG